MIICPECGQQAADDAKFCDRCGQGLAPSAARTEVASLPPLAPGAGLKGGYRIVALLSQRAGENRYHAERASETSGATGFMLREQSLAAAASLGEPSADAVTAPEEDPAGPRAKTAELRLRESANGAEKPDDSIPAPVIASPEPGRSDEMVAPEAAAVGIGEESGESPAEAAPATTPSLVGPAEDEVRPAADDLGEMFGRVRALSLTLEHPALQRAEDGFAENGRVYLAYRDEPLIPLAGRPGGLRMSESAALNVAIQVCQAVAFVHRRGLRVNDICPESVAYGPDGRIRLTGLDYVTNDNELQGEPLFNDGYTAPEIYRAKKVDKRADVFAIGALLYSCLTGERLEAESWREEAGPIRFYPPHVVSSPLEQVVRRALVFDPAGRWPTVDALKAELVKLAGTVRLRSAALTDVGRVRELNEDCILTLEYRRDSLIEPANGLLYLIADGMGGAEAGEVASALAVETVRNYVEARLGGIKNGQVGDLLKAGLEAANSKIIEYQAVHEEARGMGSTGVGVLIVGSAAAIAWVGDSRAYLSQKGGLRQLSKDHSLVQRLIEIGQITPEEARHHEHKNVITRSLGARPKGAAGAEAAPLPLRRDDRVLLCSDGLTAHVEDASIQEILRRHDNPEDAARELVVAANAGGGTDNVSVVVVFAD